LASRRIARTKSFSAYLSSINDEVSVLKSRADTTGRGIEDGAISGTTLADEVSLVSNGISSSNYIPNYSGWRISGSGVAEFSNVFVRGDINAYSGTIGYWNISSPSVSRTFGTTSLYGTFLESSDVGDSDANKTDGTYVGLFKSYTLEPNLIVSKYRKDNIATITTPGHAFLVGDLVYVSVTGDTSFSSIAAPVAIIAVTGDTISYINEGDDFTNLDASDEPVDNTAAGTVTLYNPDVAGLYLRDYAKREFDYGYFSNTGVSYVSAEDINVIENPSFEYIDSSDVLTSDHTTSWTAGVGLNYALETFSAPSLSKPYKNNSAYGGRLTWNSGGLSTYLSSTIDYAAGAAYQVFGIGRDLYFGATVFPRYTPPIFKTVDLVETATLSNSFTSATANTTTITYTGSGLTFSAGQYVTVAGYANPRFNITAQKIATATATTVTVNLDGTAETTETSTRTATSKLLKVTTSTSHGLAAGETVFLDMDVVYEDPAFGGDVTNIYSPHTIPDGTQGYTFTVSASPAPTGSIVYLSTEFSTMETDGTDLTRVAHNNKDGSARDRVIWKAYETALDLSAITISYPNVGTTTPIADVLSSGTAALWDAGIGKYLLGTANSYMLGYLDTDVGISALTNINDIVLDGASIAAAYQAADPVGYAAQTDIKLNFPGWLLLHDGNGVVPASPTKISSAGYIIDNVYLSTSSNFFYGSELATNRWYATTEDVISYDPAQASIEGTKTWLDINLENQSASLDYFDYIGFRNNTFGSTMLVRPSIGVYDSTETYLKFPDPTYETTTVTGGQYQYLTTTQYINVSPSLKLITGTRSVSFELAASTKNINLITGESSISSSAVIAGTYNEESNQSTIYVGSDKFVWTEYPATLDNEVDASVIFTPALASFAQRIRTEGSVSAGAAIYTSAGNIRTLDGDIYTSVGDIYTSDGRVTATTARLTSTTAYNLSSTTHPFQVGPTASSNLRIDDNGIQTVNNGSASTLNINTFGGSVDIGNTTSLVTANGNLTVTNDARLLAAYSTVITGRDAYVSSGGLIGVLSVSSRRFKREITPLAVDVEKVLNIEPVTFKYNSGVLHETEDQEAIQVGFIAEDLDAAGLTNLVEYDEDGVPQGIFYSRYITALQAVVRHQASQIQSLSDRLDALEGN
jgi:hypothetical protein